MPTLNVNGHSVSVDDSFLKLSPDQQNATVDEIAKSLPQQAAPRQPSISDAVTDIPAEIGRTADANLSAVTDNLSNRGANTSPFGFLNTGKAVLGGLGLIASPITGAARSLIGHPMAQAEHAVGTLINPDVAAKDDPQQMYQNAAGDVETALSAARPAGVTPMGLTAPVPLKVAPPTSTELKAAAKAVYQDPTIKSISVPPSDVAALSAKIQGDLVKQGFRPTAGSAPGTLAEINRLSPPQGVASVGIDDLTAARRALGMTAKQIDPATFTATPDANAASQSIRHLNDFLDTLAPELKTANANYAAGKSADRLDYRLIKAERRAAKTGIGGNLENTMRQEADKISTRGLTPEEQAAQDRIVMGSGLRNSLRTAGKLGVDGGLSLTLHAAAGLGSHGATLPITAAGTAARKIGEMLTRSEINKLGTSIRGRAPLAVSNQAQAAVARALLGQPTGSGAALIPAGSLSSSGQRTSDPRRAALIEMLLGQSLNGR